MSNRSSSNSRKRPVPVRRVWCSIHGCKKRPIMGYDVLFCERHLREVSASMMAGQMLSRCFWPGCRNHIRGDLKICSAHAAIIVNEYVDDRLVINTVAEMKDIKFPPESKPKTEGHVYFLLSDNAVKIGWTSDLEQRMKSYSPGTKILAVMPGTRKDETRMHRKFAHLRTNRREWFAYAPQVMEEVDRIVKEHGDPPRNLNEPMTTTRVVGPRLTNYIGGDRHPYGTARAKTVRG